MKIKPLYIIILLAAVIAVALILIPKKEKDTPVETAQSSTTPSTDPTQAAGGDKKYETFTLDIAGKNIPIQDMAEVLPKLDENQKNFLNAFIAAINAHDAAAFRKLVLPASLECLDKADQIFVEYYLGEQIKYNIPAHYAISLEAYTPHFPPDFQKAMDQWYIDPVPNTHLLFLHYRDFQMGTETIQQKLLAVGDDYYVLLGCPTEVTITQYLEANKANAVAQTRFKEVYPELTPELGAYLKAMLKKGQYVQAVTHYSEQTKEDEAVANLVIQELQKEINKEKAKASGNQ